MKIVSLDFDGVLCNRESISTRFTRTCHEDDPYGPHPDCVAALNRILKSTGAKIVVSSTWRRCRTPRTTMAETLNRWGVDGLVIDVTPVLDRPMGELYLGATRGREIKAWLAGYRREPIDSFVILDDDADMDELSDRLIRTDFEAGLTEQDADRAIQLLREER